LKDSTEISLSLARPDGTLSFKLKVALTLGCVGLLLLVLALFNIGLSSQGSLLIVAISLISIGVFVYANGLYINKHDGIKNNGVWFKSISSRGTIGWVTGVVLTSFYVILYFYPKLLGLGVDGQPNSGLVALFDPLSSLLNGNDASQWFVYGTLYTLAILLFGYKFILKYSGNRYQQFRTFSVMLFQLGFAFLIPEFMARLSSDSFTIPSYDLKNMWPLSYDYFDQYRVDEFIKAGNIGLALLIFGVLSIFVISPILTYKYGKRWYCSWVCGCGGLAETAGDSFRQLSSKKLSSWKVERWLVHIVLVFSILMTTAVIGTYLGDDATAYWLTRKVFLIFVAAVLTLVFTLTMIFKRQELGKDARYGAIGFFVVILSLFALNTFGGGSDLLFISSGTLRSAYGFYIGSIFSGVIGTGFYPILGNRVWCRYGCPMAAVLGFQQRLFSKFRITTNGGQCISCGNCSTYCEMGIDVRAYAQKGENIIRSSCVGCGVCAAVCPRGVLKLENGSLEGRINSRDILLGNNMDVTKFAENKSE